MKQNRVMVGVFLTPALLLYLLIFLYPTVRTTFMSFFSVASVTDAISTWSFVGLQNFVDLSKSSLFMLSMKNLVSIWFWGGLLVFFWALLFAVILTSGVKGKAFYRAVIYLPNVVSAVAMGTMWIHYVYNSRYGLLYKFFSMLRLDSLAAIQWTTPDMIFISLLIAYCFGMVGYYLLIFMAGIEGIPVELYESATIDGAGGFQKFRRITLPLLKDIFRTSIVLWTISTVSFFVWSQIFSPLNPEPGTVSPMVYMYQMVFGSDMVVTERNVGMGAAVGVILTLIVIIMFLLSNVLIKGTQGED